MRRLVAIVALQAAGCIGPVPFACDHDGQCLEGVCEANGYCSFPDESCTSGKRYGTHAAEALADTCVKECIRDIAVGETHACLRTEQGAMWCWGSNDAGQLGSIGPGIHPPTELPTGDVRQIAAGGRQTCAIVGAEGAVYCSSGAGPQLVVPQGATMLALGKTHGCAALVDESVLCWGSDGTNEWLEPMVVFNGARALSAGGSATCASTGSALYCWGDNLCGQLGITGAQSYVAPTASEVDIDGVPVLGDAHACGIHVDDVGCWGDTDKEAGCDMRIEFEALEAEQRPPPRELAAGRAHSCVLYDTDAVACWGDGTKGQLGPPLFLGHSGITAINVALPPIQAVAAGGDTSCALTKTGAVLCWGNGAQGQLVGSDKPISPTPINVSDSVVCP